MKKSLFPIILILLVAMSAIAQETKLPKPGDLIDFGPPPWNGYAKSPTMRVPTVCGATIPEGKVCVVELFDDGYGNVLGLGIVVAGPRVGPYPTSAVVQGEWTSAMRSVWERFCAKYKKK